MRKSLVLALAIALTRPSEAKVWTTVYRCDGVTPLATVDPNHPTMYRDIMVGTRLVLVVGSDTTTVWSGALAIPWDDLAYGELAGRGFNPKTGSYSGSCLPAAGPAARAYSSLNSPKWIGLTFNAKRDSLPGDWFVVDYLAQQVGPCEVEQYDFPLGSYVLWETLHFTHVPSRDFNGDGIVDFQDFALLASHWGAATGTDPESAEGALDLDSDGQVDLGDLALFSEYWLARTECTPAAGLNHPSSSL
jgi:hypothetical protein